MDFFAQAYDNGPKSENVLYSKDSPLHSPKAPNEGVCQGYGSELNAHLRRASSGLESDVPRLQPGVLGHFLHRHHHQNHEDIGRVSPLPMSGVHLFGGHSYFSLARTASPVQELPTKPESHSTAEGNSPRVLLSRRTSVSNPCLLHHTNSNGDGVVRPPVMPRSVSSGSHQSHEAPLSPKNEKGATAAAGQHEPAIMEGRELRL
ncbi:hypothetical protein BC939DRAFT_475082 [Gamsiella multidivaricata]|uniref:uncharacterized protein n=1 Tax=Gamsiella multidivaricata TaxID=101098 RepID=UPI0022209249|nr:uncharacterized protein BC939DRAFT_475082 [Gamsiella multidivaricata]KAG0354234.1 hypothetical protein BGZ54_001740 [Gamsiella multidivaricata]KAI7828049.1 hypothetical protein BC939DRAFT_475082 [Gamsiella multidivaricata]